jgi:hypothetical protein
MSEQKMSFMDYMRRIQDEGFLIENRTSAESNWVTGAVKAYGKDDVREALKIIMPRLVEKSCKHQIDMLRGYDSSINVFCREAAEAFRENYEGGRPVQLGPFTFVKRDGRGILYPTSFNSYGR